MTSLGQNLPTSAHTGNPWTLSEQNGRTFIKRALDLGINFFDTANNYSDGESEAVSEEIRRLEEPCQPHP
jgi:aryl-alcohol dehydrogenase-like predicted oxidoreductase